MDIKIRIAKWLIKDTHYFCVRCGALHRYDEEQKKTCNRRNKENGKKIKYK